MTVDEGPEGAIATINTGIARLRALTQVSHQQDWRWGPLGVALTVDQVQQQGPTWAIAPLNDRDHVAWPRGQQSLWLYQRLVVPITLQAFPLENYQLRLGLTWWADWAEIFVNGDRVQEGDLFDCFTRILLSDRVAPGDCFELAIHLISPGHDEGALVRSEAIYEAPPGTGPEPGFIADELAVLSTYLQRLRPDELPRVAALVADLDWSRVGDQAAFMAELQGLRQRLLPWSGWIKQRQLRCVGHAHLDLAWLWPIEDTWDAAQRTFHSVLGLQRDFPALTYTHSSPALFQWLETHQPDLFRQAQAAIAAGSWSVDAGLWVEPELNTIGGESLARQILYGQRYCQQRFGATSPVAWLPDSFGFSWQLPQLLAQGEIRYFATQKLRWNDTNPFPHDWFWWQGRDGTAILSVTLPPIGSDVDPVKMAELGAAWEQNTGIPQAMWLPGMGDHGGGPTRDMLEKAHRWQRSPFFPTLDFCRPVDFLQDLEAAGTSPAPPQAEPFTGDQGTVQEKIAHQDSPDSKTVRGPRSLPVWRDELYLELHRGCYTTHGDQKWYNRHCETQLVQAELWSAIACLTAALPYPHQALETAWKQVLFNQFHDILPGTAIPEVFQTANRQWQGARETAAAILQGAIAALGRTLTPPPPPLPEAVPVLVWNSVNQTRSEVVALPWPQGSAHWRVVDGQGQPIPSQRSERRTVTPPGCLGDRDVTETVLLFVATDMPPIGYGWYWLMPGNPSPAPPWPGQWQLENEHLRVTVDGATGDLVDLWDRRRQRQAIAASANQLQAFQDAGQYWDAWNIAPDYADHPLPPAQLQSITWVEYGPVRQRLRVVRAIADSTLTQDYVLDQGCPYLRVETVADWQATQVVLKVAFPLAVTATAATYEIPFGAIDRPIQSDDPWQRTKWEVPALGWADLSDGDSGVSVLTDYKHGFDAQPSQLRLTLLKAPLWPDPQADRGLHGFTYALYPHGGDWRKGQTPHQAIAFQQPMQALVPPATADPQADAPMRHSFLALGDEALGLAVFKPAEEGTGWILRCWDRYGDGATFAPETPLPLGNWTRINLLETPGAIQGSEVTPWTIETFKFPHQPW
jgi:alpha-mannosidase